MFPNSGNVSADPAKSIGTLGAAEATGAFLFNRGHSHGGSSGSPITSIPGGSLVVEYTDDNGTTSTDAVFTAAGAADFSGTVTQQSGLTSETPNAFELFNSYSTPDGASVALPIMSMDPEGDANFIGITMQDLFTSGVAYVDNNYIFTTGSGLSPYTLDYALVGGEGREEFGSSPALFRYYLKDHLGSTRAVWAPDVGSGQLTEATGYLPYGTQVPIITPTGDEATREKFTGKELDKDGVDAGNTITGVQLSYFGKRYYDGMAGMWTSTDPDHQFMDAYAYGPYPINGFDPDGKEFFFGIEPAGAGGMGHMYAIITDGNGNFYRFDQGAIGGANNDYSQLISGTAGGASVVPIQADMAAWLGDKNMIYVPTTAGQDKLIFAQAQAEVLSYQSGSEEYGLITNNCADAVRTVAAAGGVQTPAKVDPRPTSYFSRLLDWFGTTFTTGGSDADATSTAGKVQ